MKKKTETLKRREARNGRIILADGEVTGHHHSFADDVAVALVDDVRSENSWVTIKKKAPIKHQEHAAIVVPNGQYYSTIQVQYTDANEPIKVED